jgi:hypothetical protein
MERIAATRDAIAPGARKRFHKVSIARDFLVEQRAVLKYSLGIASQALGPAKWRGTTNV